MAKKQQTWQNRIVESGVLAAGEFAANPLNWRRHPAAQADALTGALNEVGWVQEVIVNRTTGLMLDGHLRVALALKQGKDTPVPVKYVELSADEERLVLATLDPIAAMAEADAAALDTLMKDINTGEAGLQAMLAELAEANGLYKDDKAGQDTEPQIDETEAEKYQQLWQVKPGDVWQLGRHRIACINSLDEVAVKELIAGDTVGMVWADPPYGINIVAANVSVGGGEAYGIPFGGVKNKGDVGGSAAHIRQTGKPYMETNKKKGLGSIGGAKPFGDEPIRGSDGASNRISVGKYFPVAGDDSVETAVKSVTLCLLLFPDACQIWWGGNYYTEALFSSPGWIVWDKDNTGNFADCELAWTNQKRAARIFEHRWNGMLKGSEQGQRRVHPTQKPVMLAQECFEKYGEPGDVVFDPFLGSGISVIAAEKMTDRTVIGCELAPEYIATTIQRWVDLSGKTPVLIQQTSTA